MKALNLDALVAEKRTVTLFGVEYEVIDMTVQGYLETIKAAEQMDENTPPDEAMEESISAVLRCVPSLDRETLKKLSLVQLGAIIKFARGGYDEETAKEGEVSVEEKKPVKTKKAK